MLVPFSSTQVDSLVLPQGNSHSNNGHLLVSLGSMTTCSTVPCLCFLTFLKRSSTCSLDLFFLGGPKACYLLLPEHLAKNPCGPYLVMNEVSENVTLLSPIITGTCASGRLTLVCQKYSQNVLRS